MEVAGADDDDVGGGDYYLNYVAHWTKRNTNFLWEFCCLSDRHLRILNC